jgi:serine/threonine protein kinase
MSGNTRSFGPYALVRRLGAGGMAETFEGIRSGPGGFEQRVCVKRILPEVSDDPNFVRLFREEARVAARLRHANIVQLLDVGDVDGAHYLTLELVLGCDLRRLLQFERARQGLAPGVAGGGLTSGIVAFLAAELATALEVAHGGATAIVHRDISPSNVLLSTAGEVKLADFGIARAITDNHATRTQSVRGKVPYMAPEYALRGVVDRRVDLFALGVLLYEALAGVRPFDGKSDVETLRHLEQGLHTPLAQRCPGAPAALVAAIEDLILPDPDARTPNATALLDALVDVAPPPTARRILGELVTQAARSVASAPTLHAAIDPLAATSHATPTREAAHGSTESATEPGAPASHTAHPTATFVLDDVPAAPTRTEVAAHRSTEHTVALTGAAPLRAESLARPYAAAAPDAPTRTAFRSVHEAPTALLPQAASDAGDAGPTRVDASPRALVEPMSSVTPVASHLPGMTVTADGHAPPVASPTHSPGSGRSHRGRVLLVALALGALAIGALALGLRPNARDAQPQSARAASAASPDAHAPTNSGAEAAVPTDPAHEAPTAPDPLAASPRDLAEAPTPVTRAPVAPTPAAPPPPSSGPARARVASPITLSDRAPTKTAASTANDARTPSSAARRDTPASGDALDPTARALLTIVSDPGHAIFVDGRRTGDGTLTVPLAPGRHVLTAGQGVDAPTVSVDLARGERRRVVLR